MTTVTPAPTASASAPGRHRSTVALVAVVLLVLGFVAGVWWQETRTDTGWLNERAQMGVRVVSVEHDGRTYGAEDSIPRWRDEEGTWHSGGWPTCLRVTGSSWLVFRAVEVDLDGRTFHPIVAVDCAVPGY